MKTRINPKLRRELWGPGPWADEPDEASWTDQITGLPCAIARGGHAALCGYVGVPEGHACYGKSELIIEAYLNEGVQGGVTSASHRAPGYTGDTNSPLWWIGFDCAHYRDLSLGLISVIRAVYRDFAFAKAEVTRLAGQLLAPMEKLAAVARISPHNQEEE